MTFCLDLVREVNGTYGVPPNTALLFNAILAGHDRIQGRAFMVKKVHGYGVDQGTRERLGPRSAPHNPKQSFEVQHSIKGPSTRNQP
jgi:hypothetical protein